MKRVARLELAKERSALADARRIVVKVGTHGIADANGRPVHSALRRIVTQLCALRRQGLEVILVSSGAVAAGVEALGLKTRPAGVNDVQMCAAVGQARFISEYEALFGAAGITIGQVLLTHYDFDDRRRATNVRRTLDHLVRLGIIPIINENDVVADEELKGQAFGDNDLVSALITKLVCADALVILTTVDGLLDAKGRRIPEVADIREAAKLVHAGQKGALSKGGMGTKLAAARLAASAGASVVIANARRPRAILDALAGKDVGTFFPASPL